MSTTTTSYGTWVNFVSDELTVRQGIEQALTNHTESHDLDGIERDYRAAINGKLKDAGITLNGDEFYGPAEECDRCAEMAPAYIAESIEQVNQIFWDIVTKHAKS